MPGAGKYLPCDNDDVVPTRIAEEMGEVLFKPGIVMEGGSIDVNGRGTLITTEACLLNPNRNPHLSQAQIEQYLKDYLGVTNILWLGDGIVGDDTDGHVDDLTRFVSADTVVTVIEDDPHDENYTLLKENYERLLTMKDQDGQRLRIVTLPMPGERYIDDQRVPMSYANFYIANKSVLVPTYRHANDAKACEILQQLFPERRVVGLDCTDLIWGLGSIHCVTQQQPAISILRNWSVGDNCLTEKCGTRKILFRMRIFLLFFCRARIFRAPRGYQRLCLSASVKIRPMALLGISIFSSAASVGAMSAGLLTVWWLPAAMPAP